MNVSLSSSVSTCDLVFVVLPEKYAAKKIEKMLPKSVASDVGARMRAKDFSGKKCEMLPIFSGSGAWKKVVLVGAGDGKNLLDQRKAGGVIGKYALEKKVQNIAVVPAPELDLLRIANGVVLGNFHFKVGDTSETKLLKKVEMVTKSKIEKKDLDREVALAHGQNLTRHNVNLPANYMNPDFMAKEAQAIAKRGGRNMSVKIFKEKELKKLKAEAILSVGQGATPESRIIIFEYKGGKKADKPLALVGKGVCFDSGGYNLKPTRHIETMKSDMGGAATVMGVFEYLSRVKPAINVIGVMGAVENMISHDAYKPGDIIGSMSGKTIEITNTDAEGRLVLADCLHYTSTKLKPAGMITLATLTGAVVVALGNHITGIMGNDKKLVERVKKASVASEEDVWELPINDFFREKTKGEISDLKNWTAGVSAGSSMAAAFLQNFVNDTPWAHLDIAGTAFQENSCDEMGPKGATGAMVRTLVGLIGG